MRRSSSRSSPTTVDTDQDLVMVTPSRRSTTALAMSSAAVSSRRTKLVSAARALLEDLVTTQPRQPLERSPEATGHAASARGVADAELPVRCSSLCSAGCLRLGATGIRVGTMSEPRGHRHRYSCGHRGPDCKSAIFGDRCVRRCARQRCLQAPLHLGAYALMVNLCSPPLWMVDVAEV